MQEQFEHCEHRLRSDIVTDVEKRMESLGAQFVASMKPEEELEALRRETEIALNQGNDLLSNELSKVREDFSKMI